MSLVLKKRETNFSAKEERLLVNLVKKFASILENKKTDANMNKRKINTWIQIQKEFNSSSGEVPRSVDSLKNKYLNIKRTTKKRFAEEKKHMYGTGGGPSTVITDSPVDADVREILNSQITGFASQFDCDVVEIDTVETEDEMENICENIFLEHNTSPEVNDHTSSSINSANEQIPEPSVSREVDWSQQSVENLRTPIAKPLQTETGKRKRDNSLKNKLALWAKCKQDGVNIQQQCVLEEHKQKLRFRQEKHNEEIKQMKENHELEKKMKSEEHELKMSILKLEQQKLIKELSQ